MLDNFTPYTYEQHNLLLRHRVSPISLLVLVFRTQAETSIHRIFSVRIGVKLDFTGEKLGRGT